MSREYENYRSGWTLGAQQRTDPSLHQRTAAFKQGYQDGQKAVQNALSKAKQLYIKDLSKVK